MLPSVKNAVQLLAIDESRSFFRPIMWTGLKDPKTKNYLEQIWMPGVHSDVGGGYTNAFLSNISLLTMIDRVVAKTSLNFNLAECRKYNAPLGVGELLQVHNEYTKLWRLFCPLPGKSED